MERMRQLVSAVLAGMMIAVGGTVYLMQENPVVGSFLFSVGLFTVLTFQLQLYTGKIGYLVFQKPIYLVELAITWVGNLLGTMLVAIMIQSSRNYPKVAQKVADMAAIKLGDNLLSIFCLAVFCGILMYIAIDVYRNVEGATLKYAAVFMPVMVFILSGFEHVIANMFYFALANVWSGKAIVYIGVMTLGNSVGGMMIPLYLKVFGVRKS